MNELVSVILPSYNHARFLRERIDSILGQTYQNIELIILDDFSTDNSREVISSYLHDTRITHFIINDINSGSPFKQWKKGFDLAQGDYIYIAESDDVARPELLATLVPPLADDDIILSYCDCTIINENSNITAEYNEWMHVLNSKKWKKDHCEPGIELFNNYQRYRNVLTTAGNVLFRRSALSKIDYMSDQFRYSGDWLFWSQICTLGKVCYVAKPLNFWRNHSETTRSIDSLQKDHERMLENKKVIKLFSIIEKQGPLNKSMYFWLLDWWLRRYSYKNLFSWRYTLPPLPSFLLIKFYTLLTKRTIKELQNSIRIKK